MPGAPLELPAWEDDDARARGPTPLRWALLALAAARRRKLRALLVFVVGFLATGAYFVVRMHAPTYRVEAKILAQRQQALPSVVRSVYEDAPTRSAWEAVHRRDNLVALVQRADLLAKEAAAPGDSAPGSAPADADGEDPLERLVTRLDERLLVTVEDGTISISLDWGDPQQAYEIVRGALENFLESRQRQEVTAVDEVLAVLSEKVSALRRELDAGAADARRRAAAAVRSPAPVARQPTDELLGLQVQLESRQRALQEVEELRRRRLADLQTQLDLARSSLSNAHPTIIGLRKDIEALSVDTPQLVALREDVRAARKAFQDRLAREGFPRAKAAAALARADPADREEDARARELRVQYETLMQRLQTAQVERDAARAAFKYRYNVIWPPQVPRDPVSPTPLKIFLPGLFASALLAIGLAAAPALRRGRILQRWQVEQLLRLEVLGEIERRT